VLLLVRGAFWTGKIMGIRLVEGGDVDLLVGVFRRITSWALKSMRMRSTSTRWVVLR